MLILGDKLVNKPILSLRAGAPVGVTFKPIINPDNFKIEGLFCFSAGAKKERKILLYQDIRNIVPQGILVNDQDALTSQEDLVRLEKIIKIGYELVGKPVETIGKKRIGRVKEFSFEVETFFIKKLYVSQSIVKNFSNNQLTIDRTQVVEVTNKKVIIQDLENMQKVAAGVPVVPSTS